MYFDFPLVVASCTLKEGRVKTDLEDDIIKETKRKCLVAIFVCNKLQENKSKLNIAKVLKPSLSYAFESYLF
jgi:hypothetical protein